MRPTHLAPLLVLAACAAGNPGRQSPPPEGPPPRPAPMGDAPAPAAKPAPEKQAAPAVEPAQPAPPAEPIIARIGGREIGVSRLLSAWMNANSREVSSLLERVVTAEAVELEAQRLRIELEPAAIEAGYQQAVAELESDLREERPGAELDDWVRLELGLEPARYREGLREDARRRLLGERLVRSFVMTHERANVRVIVTQTRDEMQAVEDALAAGGSFEELAREHSLDPSGRAGGRIPPILRTESKLSRLAFLTGVGQIGGPIQDADVGRWMLLKVDSIEPALEGSWRAVGAAVEQSLAEEPVQDAEYWQWRAEMTRRYEVDLEPFFRLVEGARP